MSQSLSQIYVHIVFSTKYRARLIKSETEQELFAYVAATIKRMKGNPILINGDSDHIHVFSSLPRTITLSGFVGELKKSSSRWIKLKGSSYRNFGWQDGFAAFSVSSSKKSETVRYISRQKEHHTKMTFREELLRFLDLYEIDHNEEHLWD